MHHLPEGSPAPNTPVVKDAKAITWTNLMVL